LSEALGSALELQPEVVRSLANRYPHSVEVFRQVVEADVRTWQFNCHAFAMGLSSTDDYWRINTERPNVIASGRFVEALLSGVTPIRASEAADGDLVVYYATTVVHTGVVAGSRVVSKWSMGHTWRHGLLEVPVPYGDAVKYFRRLPLDMVVERYVHNAG
jgi:hypothetical protein